MSKLSISINFYLYPDPVKSGLHPIYCRIIINRKKAEFSLHEYIKPSKWNAAGQVVKGDPELSAKLKAYYLEIKRIKEEFELSGETPSAKEVRDKFLRKEDKSVSLKEYISEFVEQVEQLPDYSHSTFKKYKTVKKHLFDFLDKEGIPNISMKAFKSKHVAKLELYLKIDAKLSVNTATKYLKLIKTIFNRAIRFEIVKSNPFDHFKLKYEPTNREFLTDQELEALKEVKLPNDSLKRVRDLFLFSVYSGLRFTDVDRLTKKSVIVDSKGKNWLEIPEIQKTGESLRVPLLNKAKQIIDRYEEEAEITGKLLPLRSNQKVNSYLKVIAELAGIDKHLTFHMARHTFATTITLSNNISIEVVSKMLGHKNIRTTQIYAKITNQYMEEEAAKLNEIL